MRRGLVEFNMYLIYVKKNVCSLYSLKLANIVKLAAILFMQIRWSKMKI